MTEIKMLNCKSNLKMNGNCGAMTCRVMPALPQADGLGGDDLRVMTAGRFSALIRVCVRE